MSAKEEKIIEAVASKQLDLKKIEHLFAKGGDPNSLSEDGDCLFSDCIFAAYDRQHDLLPLLKLFIDYGLDADYFAQSIITNLKYIHSPDTDICELVKVLLENTGEKIDLADAREEIMTDQYFLNDEKGFMTFKALLAILNAYDNDQDYKQIGSCEKIIDQTVRSLNIKGDLRMTAADRFLLEKDDENGVLIGCDKDILVIKDQGEIYIDDSLQLKNDNGSAADLEDKIGGRQIRQITFRKEAGSFGTFMAAYDPCITFDDGSLIVFKTGPEWVISYEER